MPNQATQLTDQIKLFLEGKLNYNVGLSLFMKVSSDKSVLIDLFGAETDAKKQLLTDKLLEYYEEYQQTHESEYQSIRDSEQNNSHSRKTIESSKDSIPWSIDYRYSPSSDIPSNDSIILHLASERKKLYNIRGNVHADLFNALTDERRHELALQIMKIQADIDNVNQEIRKVESGLVPERFIKQSRSAEEYIKIRNIQQYIKVFERKLQDKLTLEQREKYEKLLAKHKSNLEKLING
jgi:hypothetical protein